MITIILGILAAVFLTRHFTVRIRKLKDTMGRISAFDNANNAVSFMAEKPVEAVLTDIKMPGVSGIELLERIRNRYPDLPVKHPNVRVVRGDPTDKKFLYEAIRGADAVLCAIGPTQKNHPVAGGIPVTSKSMNRLRPLINASWTLLTSQMKTKEIWKRFTFLSTRLN